MRNMIGLLFFFLFSCNHPHSTSETVKNNKTDTSGVTNISKPEIKRMIKPKTDSTLLINTTTKILNAIKIRNYEELTSFIHVKYGIRFSPYANIDTIKDKRFFGDELMLLAKENKKINWNSAWADDSELLTVRQYFLQFVYDVDFLNAEIKSINKFHSQGTDLNNIKEVYPGCDVVEFFFSGFEKKYEGMDFRALRLVFKMQDKVPYLVGVVHDKWTP